MARPPKLSDEALTAALADHPGSTAADLSKLLGVGQSTAAKRLSALETTGAVRRTPGGRVEGVRAPDHSSAVATVDAADHTAAAPAEETTPEEEEGKRAQRDGDGRLVPEPALWPNYQAHGATHLILARVPEDRAELDRYRAAVPGVEITVCRLTTPEPLRLERLREPMPPRPSRDWHLARSVELEDNLANLDCEDFQVENGNRPVRVVAFDVLVRAGWLLAEDVTTAR